MNAYFSWMESLAHDFRVNARNIFGKRGTHYSLWPDKGVGVDFHYSTAASTGEIWPHPYWLSAGGWCIRPFWDHYLTTGDLVFLRNRVVPAYKELALFYEDYLTVTGKDGNYVFAPSFSPENNPANTSPSAMLVINASMDIAVCREVLDEPDLGVRTPGHRCRKHSQVEGDECEATPYLLVPDGTLKKWAWPTLKSLTSHRHVYHVYGVWPGGHSNRTHAGAGLGRDDCRQKARAGKARRSWPLPITIGRRAPLKDYYMVDTRTPAGD